MKAVFCTKYGSPDVLEIREIDKPIPKDHEVLIRVHATTVSAADIRVRGFDVPRTFWLPAKLMLGFKRPRKPILGMELAGEIEAVGSDVTRFKPGDQVFAASLQTFGGYAEYICLPAEGPIAFKPQKVSYEEAAAIPIGARTALYYLRNFANIKAGQNVLIYGASGSVGTYAVQLAKFFGARVTGVCSSGNMELVRSLGADRVIDYSVKGFEQVFETYDIIFVTIDKLPFDVCNNSLADDGMYLNIGRPLPNRQMIRTALTTRKKLVVGKNVPESAEALQFVSDLIEMDKVKPEIDRRYSLEQIVEAHEYADKGHKAGNVVITVDHTRSPENKMD